MQVDGTKQIAALALTVVFLACTEPASASIIYYDSVDMLLTSQCGTPFQLDLNGDSVPDVVFTAYAILSPIPESPDQEILYSDPTGSNRVAGFVAYTAMLSMGFFIGSTLTNSYVWTEGDPNIGGEIITHFGIFDESLVPCGSDFAGTNGFLGLEFDIAGQTHYGWIQLTPHDITGSAIIRDYAYETTPGMGILAGQIPEPSTLLLAGLGGLALLWRAARGRRKP